MGGRKRGREDGLKLRAGLVVGVSGTQASRILKLESLSGVTFVHDSPGGQLVCKGQQFALGHVRRIRVLYHTGIRKQE